MRLDFGLEMQQAQKLMMTPQLQQAINILQMSSIELNEFILEEMEKNPVLEVNDEGERQPEGLKEENTKEKEKEKEEVDWEEYFAHDTTSYENNLAYSKDNEKDSFETYTSSEPTLLDYFEEHLLFYKLTETEKKIGEYIIGSLNDSGYLTTTIKDISRNLSVDSESVVKVLNIIQQLEPGIAARDLKESLLLQTLYRLDAPELTNVVIENYLELVAQMKIKRLSEVLEVSTAHCQRIVDYIKSLNPRPGLLFASMNDNRYIQPDATVLDIEGDYVVLVNDNLVPSLQINGYYKSLLSKGSGKEKEFVKGSLNAASYLIKAIEQRKNTLRNVVEYIVEYQKPFFQNGIKYLKPLRLKDVAEELEIHESTVSRATSSKSVETPRGIFQLKYFFNNSLSGGIEGQSTAGIKQQILDMINKEDPTKPLSDQKIADTLNTKGIEISRRTVAKYRVENKIPSSSKRKRYAAN
ncbi:RNA polymerase factor sigma-54 [Proteinivorax hydrogeniformans]|uniref:RNA polymerase factor sigma-54 n=1 Tax=Proteinivorax hydrogeniformans TaxID=1826727 RepID=A0AAU8HV85_9FIRM